MKKKIGTAFLFALALSLASCASPSNKETTETNGTTASQLPAESKTTTPEEKPSTSEEKPSTPASSAKKDDTTVVDFKMDEVSSDVTFDDLFNIDNKVTLSLNVSTEELQKLNSDYLTYSAQGLKSPIYRRADSLIISVFKDGKEYKSTFYNVGFRMKGNTSRHEFIDDDGNVNDSIHLKISFEETFDGTGDENLTANQKKYYKDRKFCDLSKLDVRYNKNKDQSYIKEYYALNMFRDFGIMSQHANFGAVSINQDGKNEFNYGLYLITEPLTKSFIKHSLSSGEEYIGMSDYKTEKNGTVGVSGAKYGQLYKASYGIGPVTGPADMTSSRSELFGPEVDDLYAPPYELKSNTDTNDNSLIRNAFDKINTGTIVEIGDVVDLNYFYMYEAVASFLANPDDLRNNYNNYGLYFRRTDGKMVIIPIDNDRVLGTSMDYDPLGDAGATINPFATKVSNGEQRNQLYLKTILANDDAKKAYIANMEKVLASKWVTEEYFNSIHEKVKNNYSSFVEDSICNTLFNLNEVYNGTTGNMSFKDFIKTKVNTITNAIKAEKSRLDGTAADSKNPLLGRTDIYLTSTIDGWKKNESGFKFVLDDEGNYVLRINPTKNFECKIFATGSSDLWLRADNGGVLGDGGNMIIDITGHEGATLVFKIDMKTGVLTYYFE